MARHAPMILLVWLALLVLLATTIAASFAPLGPLKPVVNLGIAFVKALLIFWFFMHLREAGAYIRLFAAGAVFWLIIMFSLSLSDWLTR